MRVQRVASKIWEGVTVDVPPCVLIQCGAGEEMIDIGVDVTVRSGFPMRLHTSTSSADQGFRGSWRRAASQRLHLVSFSGKHSGISACVTQEDVDEVCQ